MTGSKPGSIDLSNELSGHLTVYKNLSQEIVLTTTDKLELCLIKHRTALESAHNWQAPIALAVTFGSTFIVAEFQDRLMAKEFWQAIFCILCFFSLYWAVKNAITSYRARRSRDITSLIDKIAAKTELLDSDILDQLAKAVSSIKGGAVRISPYVLESDVEDGEVVR